MTIKERVRPSYTTLSNLKSTEPLSLLLILLAILLMASFAITAMWMLTGSSETFDTRVLLALRNPQNLADPLGPGWLEEIGRDITALGGNAILITFSLAVLGYLWLHRQGKLMALLAIAITGALVLSSVLKHVIDRPRPELVPHGSIVYTASFPSGHSTLASSTYLTMAMLLARIQRQKRIKIFLVAVALALSCAVGASRVYLGVHWPTDVIAGLSIGMAWALMCWLAAKRWRT